VPRYKLTIAYDGTEFCGWQKQEPPAGTEVRAERVLSSGQWTVDSGQAQGSGVSDQGSGHRGAGLDSEPARGEPGSTRIVLRTVQEVVERAVRSVVNEPVVVMGASRTDSGVHARGQVAAFTCGGDEGGEVSAPPTPSPAHLSPRRGGHLAGSPANSPLPRGRGSSGWPISRGTDRLLAAINARLPEDVVVAGAEAVHGTFDPISDCVAKGYSYTLHVGQGRPLFDRRFVHHVWSPLDVDAMRRAAEKIVGEHDFAAFAKAGHGRESTVRTVFECEVIVENSKAANQHSSKEEGDWSRRVRIEVSGSGFLYNMVRIIAGTLVEVGRGRLTPEDVEAAIESQDRRRAGPTLPPHGLCLEWVRYPEQQISRTSEQRIDV
jgi:tRNA pseudouridine38-40 synthase